MHVKFIIIYCCEENKFIKLNGIVHPSFISVKMEDVNFQDSINSSVLSMACPGETRGKRPDRKNYTICSMGLLRVEEMETC